MPFWAVFRGFGPLLLWLASADSLRTQQGPPRLPEVAHAGQAAVAQGDQVHCLPTLYLEGLGLSSRGWVAVALGLLGSGYGGLTRPPSRRHMTTSGSSCDAARQCGSVRKMLQQTDRGLRLSEETLLPRRHDRHLRIVANPFGPGRKKC